MKNKLKGIVVALMLALGVGMTMAPVSTVNAIDPIDTGCAGNNQARICKAKDESLNPFIQTIIRLLIYAIGIIAVIMIVIGGIKYTVSNGDASKVKSAKDTILYSVIGLVVALLAFIIVAFVIDQFK